jgi:hypothetical protein
VTPFMTLFTPGSAEREVGASGIMASGAEPRSA